MKRLGDWEYALGVNMMNQHLAFQTLAGARKYDYPQSFTYHEPWWKHYHVLATYFARLSLALSSGEQRNRILVLEPTTSAWMYAGSAPNPRMMEIGKQFQAFITALEQQQVEFDLGSEDIIKDHGKVDGPRFVVGRRAYDLVILPPGTENLNSPTARLIRDYLEAGGKLESFGAENLLVDGAPGGPTVPHTGAPPANPDFRAVEGKLYHQRRKLADGELWFFVNSNLDATARATVKASGKSLVRLDLFTGRTAPYPATPAGEQLEFPVDLPPAGSLLLFSSDAPGPAAALERVAQTRPATSSAPLVIKRVAPNAVRIDYCDLTRNGKTEPELYFYKAADQVFKAYGFAEGNPWGTAVQYKSAILDRNHFPPNSGFEATFWFDVAEGVNLPSLEAVVERPKLWHVSINGKAVQAMSGAWWLDREFGVYPIGPQVRAGRNSLKIAASPMSVHNELEPVYIIGDFGAAAQAKGFRLVPSAELKTGCWKDQNLPFYSEAVSYSQRYSLPSGRYKVVLGNWAGTVAEVKVNGKPAGVIGWQPYEVSLGELVKPGENNVEVLVSGSLKNLLGPHHGKIAPGLVSPWLFRNAPAAMPPGSNYDQQPYGLMEPFHLVEVK
jgi:hypothetical protein